MDELFEDMRQKGKVTVSSSWLERAVEQRKPQLTLDLANSIPLQRLDRIDMALLNRMSWN